ncbi:MAG TPA: GNAT family N-acetyltransferase [Gemmatimonadaceae bacterium]|nr:GNAT family N-acetyltransferase [Gemmatimonadaceae bacterium]
MITVRAARDDELPVVADLIRRAYAEYGTIMSPTSWAGLSAAIETALASSEPAERIVAEDDGRIVGAAMLYPPAANAYGDAARRVRWPEVRLVSVDPAMRGRGIARALMAECVRRARAAGATEIGLHTSHSMQAAIRMYRAMGFERAPESDFQPPGAERVEGYRLALGD